MAAPRRPRRYRSEALRPRYRPMAAEEDAPRSGHHGRRVPQSPLSLRIGTAAPAWRRVACPVDCTVVKESRLEMPDGAGAPMRVDPALGAPLGNRSVNPSSTRRPARNRCPRLPPRRRTPAREAHVPVVRVRCPSARRRARTPSARGSSAGGAASRGISDITDARNLAEMRSRAG